MRKFCTRASVLFLALVAAASSQAASNVALGSTVVETGSTFGSSPGWCCESLAAPSSVTDGIFLPDGAQWNSGTVFWTSSSDNLTVFLPAAATVSSITMQADNADFYTIAYLNPTGNWQDLSSFQGTPSWGLATGEAPTFTPITTTAFRITASGDGAFAVSEFQALGTVVTGVPEPATTVMMLTGGAALLWSRRRAPAA